MAEIERLKEAAAVARLIWNSGTELQKGGNLELIVLEPSDRAQIAAVCERVSLR